jgi:hypothetical protein
MKTGLRISIKDYSRNKTLPIRLARVPFSNRLFEVQIDRRRWPADGRPVSLTRVMTALRKALVKSVGSRWPVYRRAGRR